MTSWVSTEILRRKTPSQRAMVIENFVQIANFCYKHNDLHCALNITIALGSACIKSLRHTWSEVDKKVSMVEVVLFLEVTFYGLNSLCIDVCPPIGGFRVHNHCIECVLIFSTVPTQICETKGCNGLPRKVQEDARESGTVSEKTVLG